MLTHLFESRGKDTVKEKTTTTKVSKPQSRYNIRARRSCLNSYNFQPPAVSNESSD